MLARRFLIPVLAFTTVGSAGQSAERASAPTTVVVAVGDTSCSPADPSFNGGSGTTTNCTMKATSEVALALSPSVVLALGDTQYEVGALEAFQASYAPTWGRLLSITRPVPGNHEYYTAGAAGYYAYFGSAAGDPSKGYYSFDLPGWHLIALNSSCAEVGGCGAGSPQEAWLRADLASHRGVCTLAYWHQPRFSSGNHGSDATYDAFWRALYEFGTDVVLNGHDHDYERFHRMDPDGLADPARGIREFVVGTGGKNHVPFGSIHSQSAIRANIHGVLRLALKRGAYEWSFEPIAGSSLTDRGETPCHRACVGACYFPVTPCRLADTRDPEGPFGAPPLAGGESRSFVSTSRCGVPDGASAVAANLTVVDPTADGDLRVFPTGEAASGSSTINFRSGVTRANNAVLRLGTSGSFSVHNAIPPGQAVHLVVDVNGYFLP